MTVEALDISSLSCVTDCSEVESYVFTSIKTIIIIIIIIIIKSNNDNDAASCFLLYTVWVAIANSCLIYN